MHALVSTPVQAERFVRKLRGGSQPVLVEGTDKLTYVLKFANNLQGPNLLFNESVGTELFRTCGLPVSPWKPIVLTREFVDRTPDCWMESDLGELRPTPGICFGSVFLGAPKTRPLELLPGPYFAYVRNRNCFWLAWLLDVCCQHVDNRQAMFVGSSTSGYRSWFIDMGHMFGGPIGDQELHHPIQPRYLDERIYPKLEREEKSAYLETIRNLDADAIWDVVNSLPEEWISVSALRGLSRSLNLLATPELVQEHFRCLLKTLTVTREIRIPKSALLPCVCERL
jgi:hypothetical protein